MIATYASSEVERLTAEVERLSALLAVKSAPRLKVARKVSAAAWPGRRAMVDDLEAGFTAAEYLAAGRAGWRAPGPSALDPWMRGAPIPVGEDALRAAGWLPVTYTLQGGKAERHGSAPAYFPPDGEQSVSVAGWVESSAYHETVCARYSAAARVRS